MIRPLLGPLLALTAACSLDPFPTITPTHPGELYVVAAAHNEARNLNVTIEPHISDATYLVPCENGTHDRCQAAGWWSTGTKHVYFYGHFVRNPENQPHLADLARHEVCHRATGRLSHLDPKWRDCMGWNQV